MGVKVREWKKGVWWILIDHKGKRKSVKVGSKEAAKAAARKIEEALTTGKLNLDPPKPLKSLLFTEYAEKWFAGHVSVNLKPSTQHGVRLILDKALLPAFGDKPLDKITRDDVKTFAYRMLEAGRAKEIKLADGGKTKTLSRSSVMGMGRTLSAIFNHAIEDGILTSNPAQRPGRYIRTGDRREKIDFLTPEEGRILLEAAKAHRARHYPILATALYTGARQGELLALQWGDIDWHGKFIEIRRANWRGIISTPKSGKGRRVDLADHLAGILSEHRRVLVAEALKAGKPMPDWVFPSEEGTPLDAANLRKVFAKVLKKAGLRQIRFHDLRHTFASWLIANGESLAYVKEQMGHHSIQITVDTYGHLIPGANREAVNRLAAMVENPQPIRNQAQKRGQAESPNPAKRLVGHEGFEPSTS
ncbi:MAG TPA: tyrosine-type recombinase/integrase [Candidatus Limnocylindria bacterium]|nr:tyrosine-type recombinase/integrase [Candidatus Limnocylindria bacterium]